MPSLKNLIAFCLLVLGVSSAWAGEKKQMMVAAGDAATKVNNHYWSYTTPGQSNTSCSGYGTVNATATATSSSTADINGTVNTNTDCDTTYRPPATATGNRVTVDNSAWVTDMATGDRYLIQCTANWVASKCSSLEDGTYKAALQDNNMWITGRVGMKEATAKYHVLRFVAAPKQPPPVQSVSSQLALPNTPSDVSLSTEEAYAWAVYERLSPEDRDYVRVFCAATPTGAALVPRAKIDLGQQAEHSMECAAWIAANAKKH